MLDHIHDIKRQTEKNRVSHRKNAAGNRCRHISGNAFLLVWRKRFVRFFLADDENILDGIWEETGDFSEENAFLEEGPDENEVPSEEGTGDQEEEAAHGGELSFEGGTEYQEFSQAIYGRSRE